MVKVWACLVLALAACSYNASFGDCTVSCTAASGCPGGLSCGAEGLCRAPGAPPTCAGVLDGGGHGTDGGNSVPDGPVSIDGPIGSASTTLTETTSNTIGTGNAACVNTDMVMLPSYSYWVYRAFALTDYPAVTGTFHITAVDLGMHSASSTYATKVTLDSYSGTVGSSTLATSQLTLLQTTSANFSGFNQMVPVQIAADISAGQAFVVKVEATQAPGVNPLGANESGETHPAYLLTQCGGGSTTTIASSTYDYVINVEGWYEP